MSHGEKGGFPLHSSSLASISNMTPEQLTINLKFSNKSIRKYVPHRKCNSQTNGDQ